jgi:NTP pyrophosphatase (non-canonical NTP hydrolase)
MDLQKYSVLALSTAVDRSQMERMLEASMGMAGEAGEVVDLVKKIVFYGRGMDPQKLIEEMGDLVWYINLAIYALDTTWETVLATNIAKLSARYPDLKFSADRANNRDLEAELDAMARELVK